MTNKLKFALIAGLLATSLTGCIAVSDHGDGATIATNTDMALRVCGGEGNVKEVTEEGYTCMEAEK